jgi:hypothetical protein
MTPSKIKPERLLGRFSKSRLGVQKTSRLYDPERAVHILLIRCVRCGNIPDIAFGYATAIGSLVVQP